MAVALLIMGTGVLVSETHRDVMSSESVTTVPNVQHRDFVPNQTCFQFNLFCDKVNLQVDPKTGLISGVNTDCETGEDYLVGGVYLGKLPGDPQNQPFLNDQWVLFIDYNPHNNNGGNNQDYFEYAVITGQGLEGTMQRYWPDGKPYDMDPTMVSLVSCLPVQTGDVGPSSYAY